MKKLILILFTVSLCHQFTVSQEGWFVQYGTPTSDFNKIFMNDSLNGWVMDYDSVFHTTNGGVNWIYSNVGYNSFQDIYFINNNTGWIAALSYIIKTTNTGQNWFLQLSSLTQYAVWFVDENTGFVFGETQLSRRTTNGGTNWTTITIGPGSFSLYSVEFINHDTGWVGGQNGLLYKTTNCGLNWLQINTGVATRLYDISFPSADTGWAGGFDNFGQSKIIFTSNAGINWVTNFTDAQSQGVESIFFITPKEGWAAGLPGKIMHTTNAGLNWEFQTSNAGNIHLFGMYFVTPKIGWIAGEAGDLNGKILKTTTGGIVPVKNISNEIPNTFHLYQNYPNPFNPKTMISFDISYKSMTTLMVYDILGKEVEILINQNLSAGSYSVDFDAKSLSSGLYFYKLVSGNFSETLKMILIK